MLGWLLLAGQALAQGTDPAIQKGLAWLQGQIGSNGQLASEAASPALPMQVRSETATTLKALSATVPAALYAAIDGITPDTTEYLARKALAKQLAGSPNAPALNALVQMQNADGGFGAAVGLQSNPLDTAHALMALAPARTDTTLRALMWLAGSQQANGSWLLQPDSDAVVTTALATQALTPYRDQADAQAALTKARAWLLAQRNTAQTWDDDMRTAQALLAVLPGLDSAASVQPAIDALRASQLADGSWAGDPYTTALALRALWAMAQPNPNQILIQGRVVDGQTGLALSGVSVALNGAQSYSQPTDANGQFEFTNPAPGSYTLSVSQTGFGTVTGAIAAAAGQTLNIGTIALLPISAGATTG
ncbi:MAG: carboxypeptidase regulatory-like domain-containing protein, partial [Burkholderiaceae bacterium]|nr:carboxypeptidase regulatory-like domain-containing protein [Burkholderiaceae bacterium]